MRVLIIDDHALFRVGLKGLLEQRNIEVVGVAAGGKEGIELASELKPDIVLLDLRMPEMGGLEVLKVLREKVPDIPIVVLTTSDEALARMVQGDTTFEDDEGPFSSLTPREHEILCLLADGQSNKLIARNLGISDGTVKLHVKAILRKLGIHSRVEAAVIAVEQGLRKPKQASK